MAKRIFSKWPSPALVIACMSLFVALGGGAYAAATGSIDGREIKNGSIRNVDFKDGTLRGQEAKRDGFGGGAIKESTLGTVPNANTVGGRTPAQIGTRWALINEAGNIEAQSGGFSAVDCYQTNANCYINAGEDVRNRGLTSTIGAGNTGSTPRLVGEIGNAPCGATFVNCAPPNTEDNNVIVIAPRESDGGAPAATSRFRFYVTVTGS